MADTLTFSVNGNNDLFLNDAGDISMSVGIEAVKYACKNAAQAQRGEMIYNLIDGVPTKSTLWSGTPNLTQFEIELRKQLEAVDGVGKIINLQCSVKNDVVSYSAIIQTTFGEVVQINGGV